MTAMEITFNCRLVYNQAMDCARKIKELGGDGNITVGGSWYNGTKEQIGYLIDYMVTKDYDLAGMAFGTDPEEATRIQVDNLKTKGLI